MKGADSTELPTYTNEHTTYAGVFAAPDVYYLRTHRVETAPDAAVEVGEVGPEERPRKLVKTRI